MTGRSYGGYRGNRGREEAWSRRRKGGGTALEQVPKEENGLWTNTCRSTGEGDGPVIKIIIIIIKRERKGMLSSTSV